MMKQLFFIMIWFTAYSFGQEETRTSTIRDAKTNEPVPFATVQLDTNKGVISNEEGRFSILLTDQISESDSIYISSMGYEKTGISIKNPLDSIIYITPKAIELHSVFVSNKKLSADEIMENVKNRMGVNYSRELTKKRLFFRQSDYNDIDKINIDFKKSTIAELNKKFVDSVVSIIPRKSAYYTEVLSDFYGDFLQQKLHIIKAAELYDKSNTGSMEALSKKVETIMKENIKPTSYLKIKSGWFFGTKVQMDSIFENNDEAASVKEELSQPDSGRENNFVKYRTSTLKYLFSNLFFLEDAEVDIIAKSKKYEFELLDYTLLGDNSVYVIAFSPKRNADFKGMLYINTEDFAVIRIDYQNVQRLKNFHMLGIHYQKTLYKGTTLYQKGTDGRYSVKFLEKTKGNRFEVDRPLKIVEMNKVVRGRNKQNELSLNMNFGNSSVSKFEVVIFEEEPITQALFDTSPESKRTKPQYLSEYTPQFWNGYQTMEPNAAIRAFKVP